MKNTIESSRGAFTLIELLVSMTLIAVIAGVATSTFTQLLKTSQRLQALQTMDVSAKTVQGKLSQDAGAMHPCAAVWLNANAANQDVELIFMRTKFAHLDYPDTKFEWDVSREQKFTDLQWVRWHWSAVTGILQTSTSRDARWTRIQADQSRNYWKIPSGSKMGTVKFDYKIQESGQEYFSSFLSIPRLQNDTGTALDPNSPKGILNSNSWQSGELTDVGDYDDLVLQARPILFHCSDLTIELENIDGSVITADGTSDLSWAVPGNYVDGQQRVGLSARPSLIRIRFTLTDPKIKASSMYSFSAAATNFDRY
jgi:prepilin-type N-terminal cleavage/methylation domain-containing protein